MSYLFVVTSDDMVCSNPDLTYRPSWMLEEGDASAEAAIDSETQGPPSELEEHETVGGKLMRCSDALDP